MEARTRTTCTRSDAGRCYCTFAKPTKYLDTSKSEGMEVQTTGPILPQGRDPARVLPAKGQIKLLMFLKATYMIKRHCNPDRYIFHGYRGEDKMTTEVFHSNYCQVTKFVCIP